MYVNFNEIVFVQIVLAVDILCTIWDFIIQTNRKL